MQITLNNVLKMYKDRDAGKKALENYKYLFPIKSSETLAGIVGDLFGDGHLQGPTKWRIDFTSASIKELRRFEKEFSKIFKVKGKIRACKTNKFGTTFNYGINCKPISRILFLCGVPAGNKVLQPFKIPKWIFGNKNYFRRFVQRLFDCEGSATVSTRTIEIQMYKDQKLFNNGLKFFLGIKRGLNNYYDIHTTNPFTQKKVNTRKDGIKTKAIRLKIRRLESVVKFAKYINFETASKRKNLQDIVAKIHF